MYRFPAGQSLVLSVLYIRICGLCEGWPVGMKGGKRQIKDYCGFKTGDFECQRRDVVFGTACGLHPSWVGTKPEHVTLTPAALPLSRGLFWSVLDALLHIFPQKPFTPPPKVHEEYRWERRTCLRPSG